LIKGNTSIETLSSWMIASPIYQLFSFPEYNLSIINGKYNLEKFLIIYLTYRHVLFSENVRQPIDWLEERSFTGEKLETMLETTLL